MIKLKVFCLSGILALSMGAPVVVRAELTIGGGAGGGCSSVVSKITRSWMDVKRIMLPVRAKLRRVKDEHFNCISPQYTLRAMERNVTSTANLRCYSDPGNNGLGMCCDQSLRECARLRPDVAPVAPRRVAKKKSKDSKPSSASWMKVPTDEDQWVTPEDK